MKDTTAHSGWNVYVLYLRIKQSAYKNSRTYMTITCSTIQESRDHCLKGQCNKIFDNFLSQTTRAPYEQAKNSLVIFFFARYSFKVINSL